MLKVKHVIIFINICFCLIVHQHNLFANAPEIQNNNSNENLFALDYYTNNSIKLLSAYSGFALGAISSYFIIDTFPIVLVAIPVGGFIGANLGVNIAGDFLNEKGNLINNNISNTFFSLTGAYLFGLIHPLLSPIIPAVLITQEYNKSNIKKNAYGYNNFHRLAINPIGTAILAAKALGYGNYASPLLNVSYENNLNDKLSWKINFGYKNNIFEESSSIFDFEGDSAYAKLSEKYYSTQAQLCWYSDKVLNGLYIGLGCEFFYSSLSILNSVDRNTLYPGNGYFVAPTVEIGYIYNFNRNLNINIGLNLQYPITIQKTQEHDKYYQTESINELILNNVFFNVGYSF